MAGWALVGMLIAGCGDSEGPLVTGDTGPAADTIGERLLTESVTCIGIEFPHAALDGQIGEEPPAGVAEALAAWSAMNTTLPAAGDSSPAEFRYAGTDDGFSRYLVLRGSTVGIVQFQRTDDDWRFYNSVGDCMHLRRLSTHGRTDPVFWRSRAEPGHRVLDLYTHEQDCASGRTAENRLEVHVEESSSTVDVVVVIQPVGSATCPSNPPTPLTVELDEPLGARVVRDQGAVPIEAITDWVPESS